MKYFIQLEELGLFALAVYGLYVQPLELAWWAWVLLFLSPDLGMLGYLVNTKVGAVTYNFCHHRFIWATVLAFGYLTENPSVTLAGLLALAHSSFDRSLGYGLKFSDNFKHTHLGWIGKQG